MTVRARAPRQVTLLQALVGGLMFSGMVMLLFAVLSRWGVYVFVPVSITAVGSFVVPTFLRVSISESLARDCGSRA